MDMQSNQLPPSRRRRVAVGLPLVSLVATLAVIVMHATVGDPWGYLAGSLALGGVLGALPLLIDDTRERVEHRLEEHQDVVRKRTDELRHRITQLEDFHYLVGQDLQEPLRVLEMFAAELRTDLGGLVRGDIERDLDHIECSASRMQRLVHDMMRLARVARVEIESEPVPVGRAVDEAVELLRDRIETTGAQVACIGEPLPEVTGSRALVVQLFQCLIQNAITFSGGSAPRIEISAARGDAHGDTPWVFEVRDFGIGVDPAFALQVFEPFRRLHDADLFDGTGVGLTVCRTIVERHGGSIWIEPREEGTAIRFTLGDTVARAARRRQRESSSEVVVG